MDDSSISSFESIDENEIKTYNTDEHGLFLHELDTTLKGLDVCPYDPFPSVTDWRALGQAIGASTSLQYLYLCTDLDFETEDIATTDNLEAFIRGIAQNRSIKELEIQEYDFSRARLESIHPFIINNDKLEKLGITNCGFGQHDLQLLASAFSQRRKPTSIKHLGIEGINIDDESVPILVEICGYCPRLQQLDLTYSHQTIGIRGWTHLATFLEDPRCSIKCLELADVNDEGCRVLANSLVNNKNLRTLAVIDFSSDTTTMTSIGWECFLSILRNTSDINSTLNSNHSLERLWNPRNEAPDDIPEDLLFCLQSNRSRDKKKVIRKKIFHYHLNNNEKLSSIIGTDQDILPHLLGWIGKDYKAHFITQSIIRMTAFYRIIRKFPDLCSFLTIDRKIRYQLETENATIKAENANLKAENEELRQKIEQLTNMGK